MSGDHCGISSQRSGSWVQGVSHEGLSSHQVMRSSFVFLLVAAAACSSPGVGPGVGDPFDLEPGAEVSVDDGLRVRLTRVEESRCPTDVVCVWEGNAKGFFVATLPSGGAAQFVLNTNLDPKAVDVLGHRVTLVEIRPGPGASETPTPQNAYRARVKVTPVPQP